MINVMIGTTTSTKNIVIPRRTSIKQALIDNNIDYSVGGVHLDSMPIPSDDLTKSFADFGIDESCMLIMVTKHDGGSL